MIYLIIAFALSFENDNPLRLWYTLPTSKMPINMAGYGQNNDWQQNTLPIGNGFIGANIFGEIKNERITFNELTFREGGPSTKRPNYNGGNIYEKGLNGQTYRQIQQLFAEHKNEEAVSMCNQLIGERDGYGTYLEFGEILLSFNLDEDKVTDYVRYLDLDQSITYVQYKYQQSILTREHYVSHPDKIFVIKINSSNGPIPDFTVNFNTSVISSSKTITSQNQTIYMYGSLDDNQMLYNGQITATTTTGQILATNGKLEITGSTTCYLYITAATDFKMEHPKYRTGETQIELNDRVKKMNQEAVKKGSEKVRTDHIKDYQTIFNRTKLDLGQQPSLHPTNEQLENYKKMSSSDDQDRDLEILLFQYGRYLTISSSREDGILPSNLQGLWNDLNENVPWMSDYHMNINLQMNYWPNYLTNMAETAIPLIDFIDKLRPAGRITAEIYTGVKSDSEHHENGFLIHTQVTPFGWTCPGWDFSWGWSSAAVPWILQNIFDYYLFTKDEEILRKKIYPMMKEECIFFDQIMVYNEDYKRLVTSPTYSPEHGPITPGNTYEQTLLWQHYHNTIKAAQILKVDEDLIPKWNNTINQLNPIEIGDSGQIKEWYDETTLGSIGDENHRHISHLLGLYPGDLINLDNNEFMEAAKISLDHRGDYSTGWAMGHRINAWARTGDGNRAHNLVRNLLTNGIYNNLWDLHPPFQIDGNFGATSGMAEMLMQSNRGYIDILPSLPDVWHTGKFEGFVARGNIEVDCRWKFGEPIEIVLKPKFDGDLILQSKNMNQMDVTDKDGNKVSFTNVAQNRIKINGAVANNVYYLINKNPPKKPKQTPVPVSIPVQSMKTNLDFNSNCNQYISCEESKLNPNCGFRCWSNKLDSDFMEYTFKGEKFEVYGSLSPSNGKFTLLLDGKTLEIIDLNNSVVIHHVKVYTSDELDYGSHTVRIQGMNGEQFEIYKLAFWPSLKANRINITGFKTIGEWSVESDKIGGIRAYSNDKDASKSTTVECSKIWIYGSKDPNHGNMDVDFANKQERISEYSPNREDFSLVYESDKVPFQNYTFSVKPVDKSVLIDYVYYFSDEPDPTKTPETNTPIVLTETNTPAVTETNTPIVINETNTPIAVTETNTPIVLTETNTPAVTETNTPIAVTETNTPIVINETNTPIAVTETNTPVVITETNTPIVVTETNTPVVVTETNQITQTSSADFTEKIISSSYSFETSNDDEINDGVSKDKKLSILYIILIVLVLVAVIGIIVIVVIVIIKKKRSKEPDELKTNLFDDSVNL